MKFLVYGDLWGKIKQGLMPIGVKENNNSYGTATTPPTPQEKLVENETQ